MKLQSAAQEFANSQNLAVQPTLSTVAPSLNSVAIQFKVLCERLSELTNLNGISVRPYTSPKLPIFTALSEDQQQRILKHFSVYVECAESVATPSGRVDSALFLAKMIKRLGYKACSDVYEKLTSETVIEIYTRENVQVFRNFRFFEICSYSLEEVMAKQWWQLWCRDDEVNREIFLWASRVLGGEINQTCLPPVPQHSLIEIDSPARYELALDLDYLSPLFKNGDTVAAIALERVKIVKSRQGERTAAIPCPPT